MARTSEMELENSRNSVSHWRHGESLNSTVSQLQTPLNVTRKKRRETVSSYRVSSTERLFPWLIKAAGAIAEYRAFPSNQPGVPTIYHKTKKKEKYR